MLECMKTGRNEGKRAYHPFKEITLSYGTCLILARKHQLCGGKKKKKKKGQNTDADIYVSCDLLVWEASQLLQSEEAEMKGWTGWEAV